MPDKPKVAFYWCASCGGCEEAVVDLADGILDVAAAVDIVFWPVALDFKRADVEAMADGSIDVTFLNGAIRTSEQEEMAHLLRRKSKTLVAFGACAQLGGVPGLANLFDREGILQEVYGDSRPGDDLPVLFNDVRALDQVVETDYYVPGCPPAPAIVLKAVQTLLNCARPPKGAILASDRALCDECARKATKPEKLTVAEFHRPHQVIIDEEKCLLAQGLVCMGSATRGGCGAVCIQGNMPCSGCCGPVGTVRDQGAKVLSALASIIESKEDMEIEHALASIPDPAGTFYRYSLPASLLRHKTRERILQ